MGYSANELNKWSSGKMDHPIINSKLYKRIFITFLIPFMIFIMHLFVESSFTKHTRYVA